MPYQPRQAEIAAATRSRADELFTLHQQQIYARTDRMFAALMVVQWLASIAAAFLISPRTWIGETSSIHPHIWAAIFLGGIITSLPIILAIVRPGQTITRHVIAVAQMLTSALLIHLSGGRIETHFHVFGSLAFLAFYRDWRVLATASTVVVLDHLLRGIFWPQSVYGVLAAPWWRSFEHGGWVAFEDIILVRWCFAGIREMRETALQTAELEATNSHIEQTVVERTAELRASEDFARTILKTANDGFIAMNGDGQIVEWNGKAETIFGWTRDEIIGQQLADTIVPPQHRDAHFSGLQKFLETGAGPVLNQRIEITALDRQRREFPIELTITPIRLESNWLFAAFVRDITIRKKTEAELQRAKDSAEAANRAKSEFLANMSHEIRTPLNGVVGMTELALDTSLTAQQREYLTTVRSSADALLSVINDILDFSKIEAGKLHMDTVAFELSELLGETCKTLGLRAHQKGLELSCRISPEIPDDLLGDPGRLRQVIVNLAGNAIKFTKHGEVVVEVTQSSQTSNEVCLCFSVSDTGIGIPQDKQASIFEAFEQADNSTTRTYGGTGLGLAISTKLVELMGGKLSLESEVGRGSTFHFTARFGLDRAARPNQSSKSIECLKDVTALVVDDNATNRRILQEVLQHWQMKPTLVASGFEALEALELATEQQQPFQLVLLDAQMPEMDGFVLVERIKANPHIASPTLMMLSSAALVADALRCRELGISAYLTKPIKQSELLQTVLQLVNPAPIGMEMEPPTMSASGTSASAQAPRQLHILLAEDNQVNQRVARGILEKRGHTVLTVDNGLQALHALQTQQFDLILMDLQMPEMDGFAATAAIRKNEATTGKHLPIVAMTARAMKGDRESCLEAGMDDYVSKPVNPKDLMAVIEGLLPRATTGQVQPVGDEQSNRSPPSKSAENVDRQALELSSARPSQPPAIHFDSLLARVENDMALADEMIDLYLDCSPKLLAEIESGVAQRDSQVIERAAHTLKGALHNLSALPCALAALQLEEAGRSGSLDSIDELLIDLKDELQRLRAELTQRSNGVCV